MTPDDFDAAYLLRMIIAYPTIAGMSVDELMSATLDEKLRASERILAARNLRRTHELYLAKRSSGQVD